MANAKVLEQKQQVVAEVKEKFEKNACTVVADYRGLNVTDVTELRKSLREAGVEFSVIKNTLARRATEGSDFESINGHFVGPTAIAFSKEDVIAPAKILSDFAKKNENLKIKAGILEGQVVSVDQINALAALPSREGLLSMLLSVLQAPVRNFALAVKAVADKDENGEVQEA
ncbi:50S ribosomal protein L10 [Chengkuizengella marina]|uniref:Large ribosomal subunit protein uL10 n=1 Tax=Chengkuizengella marina TaxID=2507566 RepID=A0A6N9Q635_9BACL|nr:50S ribosomal protein L10 [Chengkuizengella marina]NBI30339.1 50S ribosomal protein L10 [Chengkuizengella marina]